MSVTIILVEDDPLLRTVLSEFLELGGHSVMPCANGREAVEQMALARFDLVITDLSMPEMNGFELIKILRFEWPEVKVIAMSGFLDNQSRRLPEIYGVKALLEKPFSLDEMLKAVEVCSVLRRSVHARVGK